MLNSGVTGTELRIINVHDIILVSKNSSSVVFWNTSKSAYTKIQTHTYTHT